MVLSMWACVMSRSSAAPWISAIRTMMDMAMRAAGPCSPDSSARSWGDRFMVYPMLTQGHAGAENLVPALGGHARSKRSCKPPRMTSTVLAGRLPMRSVNSVFRGTVRRTEDQPVNFALADFAHLIERNLAFIPLAVRVSEGFA